MPRIILLDGAIGHPRPEDLASLIYLLRGENIERFPDDFMFQLTREEARTILASRSQNVILKRGQNIKYLPYAFTEQGVAMLSSLRLSSTRSSN